jgi:hypothetical protein
MSETCDRCHESHPEPGKKFCRVCAKEDRLLEEAVTKCPAFLTADDFEVFMRKLAVHAHAGRAPNAKRVTLWHMRDSLTEAIIKALPMHYVSVLEYDSGKRARTTTLGSYTFKALLPQDVLYRTVEKLGIWRPIDPGESPEYDAGSGG